VRGARLAAGVLAVSAAALLAAGAIGACAVQDVIVARDQAPDGGIGAPCVESNECGPLGYCQKPSCDAPEGRCESLPVLCDNRASPVCGCDGVNYWNDCLRRRGSVEAMTPGECPTTLLPCGGRHDVPCPVAGAVCAKLSSRRTDPCIAPPGGVCWVLPDECPAPDAGVMLWESCGRFPAECTDTCSALRSERPYQASSLSGCP
jgi:hypothetical protein